MHVKKSQKQRNHIELQSIIFKDFSAIPGGPLPSHFPRPQEYPLPAQVPDLKISGHAATIDTFNKNRAPSRSGGHTQAVVKSPQHHLLVQFPIRASMGT